MHACIERIKYVFSISITVCNNICMHVFMCVLRMRIHVCNNFTYACMYATKYLCMFVYTLCKYIACMLVLSKYACMHVCVYVCLCVFVCVP